MVIIQKYYWLIVTGEDIMKIDRSKIKKYDLPMKVYNEIIDILQKELKNIKSDLDNETIYLVINNIIKSKYVSKNSYVNTTYDHLANLTKELIKNDRDEDLLELWTITQKQKNEIEKRKSKSVDEYITNY